MAWTPEEVQDWRGIAANLDTIAAAIDRLADAARTHKPTRELAAQCRGVSDPLRMVAQHIRQQVK